MRLHAIPPITSTGNHRRKAPTSLNGLAHMSLGRFISESEKSRRHEEGYDTWDLNRFTKSEFNQKTKKSSTKPIVYIPGQNISCEWNIVDEHPDNGEFAIALRFTGIEIVTDVVSPYSGNGSRPGFLIPVEHNGREQDSYLLLTTIGDIFDYEIVRDLNFCCGGKCIAGYSEKKKVKTEGKEFCPNRLFRDEVYVPQLMQVYDPLSMNVELKNNGVWITYRKN